MSRATETASAPPSMPMAPAFADPVFQSQRTFRTLMSTMAEPGTILALEAGPQCPGFSPAMTAIALTLLDFETAVWSDRGPVSTDYLRFHTGARIADRHGDAAFAFVTRAAELPSLATFRQGTLDYPDTSCTLVIEVAALADDGAWRLRGPGIPELRRLAAAPLGEPFRVAFEDNRRRFPLGVDVVLCAGTRIAALPRSITLARAEGR